jgi:hypothetical protein
VGALSCNGISVEKVCISVELTYSCKKHVKESTSLNGIVLFFLVDIIFSEKVHKFLI